MLELIRVDGNELARELNKVGPNRALVSPVAARISGTTVLFEGAERTVRSAYKQHYSSCGGDVLVVIFKPLKVKRLQGKDLSTLTILEFLSRYDSSQWKSWWADLPNKDWGDWSIANQFPVIDQSNEVVLLRKMSRLIKKGYVHGCDCGCRGDFVLSDKGRERLQQLKEANAGN